MLRQLRHDVWATDRLIAHCRGLPAEQLERTVLGTYGTVRATLAHIVSSDEGVERLFASGEVDGDRVIGDTPLRRPDQPRFEMAAWVPLTQFVHHGNDHRSHVASILSANGVPGPDAQVWPYAMALDASREVTEVAE